jgi:large subunit ribosomal protein L40
MIRYFLNHARLPRPLKFGRLRALRHWTIARAWSLYQRQVRTARELELERQYNSMRFACEELREIGNGNIFTKPLPLPAAESKTLSPEQKALLKQDVEVVLVDKAGKKLDAGRLFRVAMEKKGMTRDLVFPIEQRIPTDTPGREGWNHEWKRPTPI